MDREFFIARRDLIAAFGNTPLARQYELMQERVAEVSDTASSNVAATQRLQEATFVTLSANAELPNERVLKLGEGLSFTTTDTDVLLDTSGLVRAEGGHVIRLVAAGETEIVLPLAGFVVTRDAREQLSNKILVAPEVALLKEAIDDASAEAAGVPPGGVYRDGNVLKVRSGEPIPPGGGGGGTSSDIQELRGITGWGNYPHSGTQAIPANTRTKLVIDGTGKIESQLPNDTGPLWDTATNTIVGRNGDSIVVKVQFVFTPDDGTAAHLDMQVDIGGAVGVVEEETKDVTRGAGVAHPLSVSFPAYTLNTWAANGGSIFLLVDGPGVVSRARVVILRTHKAR